EVEAAHILAIEEATLDRRIGTQRADGTTRIETKQVIDECTWRALACPHSGPVRDEPAQHGGPIPRHDLRTKSLDVDVVPNRNRVENSHRDNLSDLACRSEFIPTKNVSE